MRKITVILFLFLNSWNSSQAQIEIVNEQKFHQLFVTTGYSTVFGAALGAAFIGLKKSPEEHLHYLAVGASMGFIAGTILGGYSIVAPLMITRKTSRGNLSKYYLAPDYNQNQKAIGLVAGFQLQHF